MMLTAVAGLQEEAYGDEVLDAFAAERSLMLRAVQLSWSPILPPGRSPQDVRASMSVTPPCLWTSPRPTDVVAT